MHWSLALVRALAVLALWIGGDSGVFSQDTCPCSTQDLCRPVPADHQYQFEVLVIDAGGTDWKNYDWSKITTVVIRGSLIPQLVCHAHANKVRVVQKEEINIGKLTDSAYNNNWLAGILDSTKALHLDGIHLELWDVVAKESAKYHALSQLTNKTVQTFHREIPGSQVTFNVPWSPGCKDGRCFNFAAIANSCDFLFVSSFDINSQMWDECFAKPNSPYHNTLSGLYAYINLGIDSRKLVLGVPWYGYDFPCLRFYEPGRCELQKAPFRGAPCSAKVGRQITYKEIMQLLTRSITGRYWDDDYKSPYYVYMVNNTYHEVWYDDPESLSLKSSILKKLKLRGIGMWAANYLNYSTDPTVAMQTEEMWNALCPIRGKWRT